MTSFTISENIEFIDEVIANKDNWIHHKAGRYKAVEMLNTFAVMVNNKYWITDEEVELINELMSIIEEYHNV